MAVNYSKASPYYGTGLYDQFLDVRVDRPITKDESDKVYTIGKVYSLRPDLLANDLYGDSSLWWVFAVRNPNTLKNPLLDFKAGTTIYLPQKETLIKDLGI